MSSGTEVLRSPITMNLSGFWLRISRRLVISSPSFEFGRTSAFFLTDRVIVKFRIIPRRSRGQIHGKIMPKTVHFSVPCVSIFSELESSLLNPWSISRTVAWLRKMREHFDVHKNSSTTEERRRDSLFMQVIWFYFSWAMRPNFFDWWRISNTSEGQLNRR